MLSGVLKTVLVLMWLGCSSSHLQGPSATFQDFINAFAVPDNVVDDKGNDSNSSTSAWSSAESDDDYDDVSVDDDRYYQQNVYHSMQRAR
jgi:hypothetical protein